jgi:hypothetical protein
MDFLSFLKQVLKLPINFRRPGEAGPVGNVTSELAIVTGNFDSRPAGRH